MMSKGKKWVFNGVAIFLVCIICFGIAEIVIRVHNAQHNRRRPIWFPDPYLGYVHSPNNHFLYKMYEGEDQILVHHRMNSLGFLGDEISVEKPEGTVRIVVIGDSYTEALQVELDKNFCKQLEHFLNTRYTGDKLTFEVINAGVSGYSPVSEYYYYKKVIKPLKPDVVIQQLFANDVHDSHKAVAMGIMDEHGMPYKLSRYFRKGFSGTTVRREKVKDKETFKDRFNRKMSNISRFYEYMYIMFVKENKRSKFNKAMIKEPQYADHNTLFAVEYGNELFKNTAVVKKAWNNTARYITALKKEVEADGAKYFMFYVPYVYQLGLKSYDAKNGIYYNTTNSTYFNKRLTDLAREEDIVFLDLWPKFNTYKHWDIYLRKDWHLNEKGHQLTAEALYQILAR